ncbi:PadR family transcriptional regulator [Neobacillus sp. DY30]|uniref:PadR family transcriptional regulator n=1 Tax=Neobacillus sp. DY30 TaxID=3047871 RepID=UPI0024BF5DAF|nr:PadR family transcriptional regulator [Neobacillus sp. DY30]WHY01417.1 PadR family transcriptional regulator [Neobacillus sp. DY30]
MEDRLKNLKKVMNKRTFADLNFSDQHQKAIRQKINQQEESDEEILLAVMQLLVHEKTGHELTGLLRGRGIQKFENNEGLLYTLLHRLEQSGCLQTNWNDSGAKYYWLKDKGRKLLKKAEQKQTKRRLVFKELLEG